MEPIKESGLDRKLKTILKNRKERGNCRELTYPSEGSLDFTSSDYLGFARSRKLQAAIQLETQSFHELGSTGSRLLSGNSKYYEDVEDDLSTFYNCENSLIFNSGYDANLGLIGCLPQENDIVIYDELVHNSSRQGMRLCRGKCFSFKHNDVQDLLKTILSHMESIKTHSATLFILVESVYSMDGDACPLKEICNLSQKFQGNLIVDEAHTTGIVGPFGSGYVRALKLETKVFARVHTFGKGMGIHGAVICGSNTLKQYLLNYCYPIIFSTSLPSHSLASIKCSHQFCYSAEQERILLQHKIAYFLEVSHKFPMVNSALLPSDSPIQIVLIPGNSRLTKVNNLLNSKGFYVRAIKRPTVPKGKERLRIVLHVYNTNEHIHSFLSALNNSLCITTINENLCRL